MSLKELKRKILVLEKVLHSIHAHPRYSSYHLTGEVPIYQNASALQRKREQVSWSIEDGKRKGVYAFAEPIMDELKRLMKDDDLIDELKIDLLQKYYTNELLPAAHIHRCAPGWVYGVVVIRDDRFSIPKGFAVGSQWLWFLNGWSATDKALYLDVRRKANDKDVKVYLDSVEYSKKSGDQSELAPITHRLRTSHFSEVMPGPGKDALLFVDTIPPNEREAATQRIDHPPTGVVTYEWLATAHQIFAHLRMPVRKPAIKRVRKTP